MIPGSISVKPNPAKEGSSVTVQGKPGQTVFVSAPGNHSKVVLDAKGKATVRVPVDAGKQFTVGDGKWPGGEQVVVSVISNGK